MLRVTRLTDYGIALMGFLAQRRVGAVSNTRDLALHTQIPATTVSKILKALCRQGLLVSQRGIDGGYRLARDPRSITVAEIVVALEGPIAITQGSAQASNCPIGANWQLINEAVCQALGNVTLHQMTRRSTTTVSLSFIRGDS